MPTIQISEEQLRKRISRIPKLLKPLTKTSIRPACGFYHGMAGTDTRIIGANQGNLSDHYRNWRFSTFVSDYRCMYFEFWKSDNGRDFYLVNMSLSIFRIDRARHDESELLALHCDPEEPDNSKHAKYKRGPHIHVKAAESPIPRAHITLTCGYLESILSSYDSLLKAMEWAIVMLKEQILDQSAA
jgi:hypothetical protein